MTEKPVVRVEEVMEQDYLLLDGLTTVADALRRMKAEKAHFLLIEKRTPADEFGIVMLSDIAKRVLATHRSPERTNMYEIMSKPVLSVLPGMDIRYCARLFDRFGISAAPVIENDQVLGVVAYDELVLNGLARDY